MYDTISEKVKTATGVSIDEVMQQAYDSFTVYKKLSSAKRASFLETIADEIDLPLAGRPLDRIHGGDRAF